MFRIVKDSFVVYSTNCEDTAYRVLGKLAASHVGSMYHLVHNGALVDILQVTA